MVEFERTIRGTKVNVLANYFVEDPSVGIGLGPDELWAETMDGGEFELTDEEYGKLDAEATEIFLGQENAAESSEMRSYLDE